MEAVFVSQNVLCHVCGVVVNAWRVQTLAAPLRITQTPEHPVALLTSLHHDRTLCTESGTAPA